MAIACLMIEAFQSLRTGLPNTRRRSKDVFVEFFEAERASFTELAEHAERFYINVRCGILHQAETNGGWRIRRTGHLFDLESRTINAVHFIRTLKAILHSFCSTLAKSEWDSDQWTRVRKKLNKICDNCIPK